MHYFNRIRFLFFIFSLLIFLVDTIYAAYLPPVQANRGMVVSEQHLASAIGAQILKKGGNAIDAMVATAYALAVVDPCDGNLGGGGFMLIHLKQGENIGLNFRETAPQKISAKLFFDKEGKQNSADTILYVGIPGTVKGLNMALKQYGTMSLSQVMQPAIQLAAKGFIINRFGAKYLKRALQEKYLTSPAIQNIFSRNGKLLQAGQRLVQKQLANTLKRISSEGSKAFYSGKIAQQIVATSQQYNGVISLSDLANYSAKFTKPISCTYRGYQVVTLAPPSSGVTVCEILNIVSGYDLSKMGLLSAATVHYNAEAMRCAYADRNFYLGDPLFIHNPLQKLLSLSYAKRIRHEIKSNVAGDSMAISRIPKVDREKPQTTHLVTADKQGNIVSMTYTLNGLCGAKIMVKNAGFFLNNQLADFAIQRAKPNMYGLVQGKANLIKPKKRPLSSMSPVIIFKNKQPFIALGAAGGATIISSIVEAIENSIDFNMDLQAAIDTPRYQMQWLPDKIYYEQFGLSADTRRLLIKMGYSLQQGWLFDLKQWGQVAALKRYHQLFLGASDSRTPNGAAIGLGIKRLN